MLHYIAGSIDQVLVEIPAGRLTPKDTDGIPKGAANYPAAVEKRNYKSNPHQISMLYR